MSLEVRGVAKAYAQGTEKITVLKDVSFRAEPGSVVAILGESGSGKSTLLSLLAGLDRADAGEILLGGERIDARSPDALAAWRGKNIGIVFQQYHLLPYLTAQENVELPLEILGHEGRAARASALLGEVGLAHRAHHLPRALSGGESQRVAIARALAPEPRLLLADEPSGNLDAGTGARVMELFFREVRKLSAVTILVTHSQELAAACDRRLRLSDGTLKEA